MTGDSNSSREELDLLITKLYELNEKGYKRSALRLAEEIRRRAREEKKIIPYLYANFYCMNVAQALFDHRLGRDRAVETIALLESEEKAREIQPDLPMAEYEHVVSWMTACAYDNLARHYAIRDGYGCEELQGLIQEGFDVCRRTGKLQCMTCFREYAVSVYETAGDLELAMHFARSVFKELPLVEDNDRRSVGALQCARQLMLLGRLEEAREMAEASLALAKCYHTPLDQRIAAQCQLGEILTLLGRREELEERCAVLGEPIDWTVLPPQEENPDFWLRRELFEAVERACLETPNAGIDILRRWDDWLSSREIWSEWFEVRLRLVALSRLAKEDDAAESLARRLRQVARRRKAWLYLSRLAIMERGTVPLSPVAFLKPPDTGIFKTQEQQSLQEVKSRSEETQKSPKEDKILREAVRETEEKESRQAMPHVTGVPGKSALAKQLDEWTEQLVRSETNLENVECIFDEMLAVDSEEVRNPEDGARLIYLAGHLAELFGRQFEVWAWAQRLLGRYPESGDVLNLAATAALAAWLASQDEKVEQKSSNQVCGPTEKLSLPALEEIGGWFRKSLELSPEYPRHYTRAAQFFRVTGDIGMAEWCLSRSFALNRDNPEAALALAEIYSQSERDQDALAVLDLCLREGKSKEAEVAWEAGLVAFRLGRFPEALTYFSQSEQWGWRNPWLYFYRAWTCLSLGDISTAEDDIARFQADKQELGLGGHVLNAWLAQLKGETEVLRQHARAVLEIPIRTVEDLSETGVEKNLQQLYEICKSGLPADDPVLIQLGNRLFEAGIVPDSIFDEERKRRPRVGDLNYYLCVCRQPLDESWSEHLACWPHQTSWPAYFAFWGVLARNTEEAEYYALEAQARCYPQIPAELVSLTVEEGGFFDHPGVVWQGTRRYDEELEAIYSAESRLGHREEMFEEDEDELDEDFDEDDGDLNGEDDDL